MERPVTACFIPRIPPCTRSSTAGARLLRSQAGLTVKRLGSHLGHSCILGSCFSLGFLTGLRTEATPPRHSMGFVICRRGRPSLRTGVESLKGFCRYENKRFALHLIRVLKVQR